MCDYCNGLEKVIGLNNQVKPCPICTDAGRAAEASRREWVEANRVSAHIRVLRFGLFNDDDEIYEDALAEDGTSPDGGDDVSHGAAAERAATRDAGPAPDGFWLAEDPIPGERQRAPAADSGVRARTSARPRHPAHAR